MGRGSSGGGSRGGRSSGGSRGGSYRSSSSGGRGRSSGSSFRPSGSHTTHVSHHHYHSYGPSRRYVGGSGTWTPGITTVFLTIIIMFALAGLILSKVSGTGSITRSTLDREPLDKQYVTLSDEWFDDSSMGWIRSPAVLKDGLKEFYNDTGVQPYLVITSDIHGNFAPSGQEVLNYANDIYNERFTDEGHMVFVFQCPDGGTDYTMAACTGAMAKTVIDDNEALEILYDYVDHYFYSDCDEDEMFANAFRDAGQRIMNKQLTTLQVIIIGIVVIVVAVILYSIITASMKRSKEKAEETERILNTPLEKLGDSSLNDLKSKYDD